MNVEVTSLIREYNEIFVDNGRTPSSIKTKISNLKADLKKRLGVEDPNKEKEENLGMFVI